MGFIEDKGLDSAIVCGLYGCELSDNQLFIQCYDNAQDLETGLKYSKSIDLFSSRASIGYTHNTVTFEALEPYLLGVNKCVANCDTLYITSNEWDLFTLASIAPLEHNIVSVINRLDDFKALANCYDFIHRFKKIILIPTLESRCMNWVYEVKKRLNTKKVEVKTIDTHLFRSTLSINKLYIDHGADSVLKVLQAPIEVSHPSVTDISQVDSVYTNELSKIYTMFDYIDALTGGMILGDVWLLTGLTGSGKTQLSMELTLAAVQQHHKVFAYSGEIPKGRYLADLLCKVVGSDYIKEVPRKLYGGREAQKAYDSWIEPFVAQKAKLWLKNKYYIYDSTTITATSEYEYILKVMEAAHKEQGCTMFVIDNLMSLMCSTASKDMQQEQSIFTNKLVEFGKKYNVHVQLVVHPRKIMGDKITNFDIAGSSNIANLAHVILSVNRIDEEVKKKAIAEGKDAKDSEIICTKNRTTGDLFKYPLYFNNKSKTFSPVKDREFRYSWDAAKQQSLKDYMSLDEFVGT
jgi:twinkle protein